MQYYKIDPDKFIQYDETTNIVSLILKSDLIQQRANLLNVPPVPSNAILLDLAKLNYPGIAEMGRDKEKIIELNSIITQLNAL